MKYKNVTCSTWVIYIAYYGRKIKKNEWKLMEGGVVSDSLDQICSSKV